MIKGIVPAAGRGIRMGLPYPKELLPVTVLHSGKLVTALDSALTHIRTAGALESVVVTRETKPMIRDYVGQRFGAMPVVYAYQDRQESVEGLPDALRAAFPYVRDADCVVMLMGDVYITDHEMIPRMLSRFGKDTAAVVACWETSTPHRFGIVSHENGRVTAVVDKPNVTGTRLMWGALALRRPAWDFIFPEKFTLSNALHQMAQHHEVLISETAPDTYYDIGTPASYFEAIRR
jgi:bifunctional UDP-N-acetylglucosamine pyrophosphorylase/glucosamine-1-phosphate N-acetyltransferase